MEINWQAFNAIKKNLEHSLCVGEEKTLTPKEIATINHALLDMLKKSATANQLLQEAQRRFRNR